MTPYAVLMVRSQDGDDAIRRRFHALSTHHHPDRPGARGVPGPLWYDIADAYSAIKTETKRAALAAHVKMLSYTCAACAGTGITGSRLRIRLCPACKGEGRAKKQS